MKLQHFGLWFCLWNNNTRIWNWSTTIPRAVGYWIYYDGVKLGIQNSSFDLIFYQNTPCIIQLKNSFPKTIQSRRYATYSIGRLLTLDDFEIIPNPDYLGNQ